jgi:hypothetical protein
VEKLVRREEVLGRLETRVPPAPAPLLTGNRARGVGSSVCAAVWPLNFLELGFSSVTL